MKILLITLLLFLCGCCKSVESIGEETEGYVRSVQQSGQTFSTDSHSGVVIEEDGTGRIISLDYVCQTIPPVWVGLHARIQYAWRGCHSSTGSGKSGWWLDKVERLP